MAKIDINKARKELVNRANAAQNALKKGGTQVGEQLETTKNEIDLKRLRPVFTKDKETFQNSFTKLVRVVDWDKRRAAPVCAGSAGFMARIAGNEVLTLYPDMIREEEYSFYPMLEEGLYFCHPYNNKLYINLNQYFDYCQTERISELETVAHKLGAKYFELRLEEEEKEFIKKKTKANAKVKDSIHGAQVDMGVSDSEDVKNFRKVEILDEMTLPGSVSPQEPELTFFRHDANVNALIKMRMDEHNPISGKKFRIKYDSSSGMKKEDAVKVDAVVKKLGMQANATFSEEVQRESRLYLQYHIEFSEIEQG